MMVARKSRAVLRRSSRHRQQHTILDTQAVNSNDDESTLDNTGYSDHHPSAQPTLEKILSLVEKELKKSSNATKAVEMQRYLKTDMPLYGIQKPQRQKIAEKLFENILTQHSKHGQGRSEIPTTTTTTSLTRKERNQAIQETVTIPLYQEYIRRLWKMPYRDYKYLAIDVALKYQHCITFESLHLYEAMLREPYMWWDLCDPIATSLVGSLVRKKDEDTKKSGGNTGNRNNHTTTSSLEGLTRLKPTLKQWIVDDNMWIRRTAILCQLKSKTSTDEELLFDFCRQCMHEKEFFIQKAIGWVLREYGKTNPSSVISFLEQEKSSLSPLSYREGSRILISKGLMTPDT